MRIEESVLEAGWKLYPNPAAESVVVESRYLDLTGAQCRVVDLAGREIHQWTWRTGQRSELEVADWPNGMYLIEVSKDGQRQSLTFVKQ